MRFKEIFDCFYFQRNILKVVYVASCDKKWKPNSAAKMLVDVMLPNEVLFLDYKFTQTYSNIRQIPHVSVSFMDDAEFKGYRLTGVCTVIDSGEEYELAKKRWEKRLISYEADRIIQRSKGYYSSREAENNLPGNFFIVKLTALEAAVIEPDRVFMASRVFAYMPKKPRCKKRRASTLVENSAMDDITALL